MSEASSSRSGAGRLSSPERRFGVQCRRRRLHRTRWLVAIAGLSALFTAASPLTVTNAAVPAPHMRSTRLVTAWLPYWLNDSGRGDGWKSVESNLGLLDQVSFFSGEADASTGDIKLDLGATPAAINSEIAILHEHDIDALLTVTRMNHVHELLANSAAVANLQAGILAAVNLYNFDGIDIDFEDFHTKDPADAARYSALLESLALRLHARPDSFGYPSTVAATILARTDRGHFTFADEQTLAASDVDQVRIMAYDQNWPGSPVAGADAPLPWVQTVAAYLRGSGDATWKYIVGIPAYGDRWPVASPTDWTTLAKGASITYPKAVAQTIEHHAEPLWSDADQAPYLSYKDNSGRQFIAFYENARSWRRKLDTVIAVPDAPGQPALGGMAEWALGDEDPAAWREVAGALHSPLPVYSAIGGCYARFGGGARFGEPVDGERDAGPVAYSAWNEREGRRQQFGRAMLYYKWGEQRAYYVEQPILNRYNAAAGPNGSLGFPTGDPAASADGRTVTQRFEHGVITAPRRRHTALADTRGRPDWRKIAAGVVIGGALYSGGKNAVARIAQRRTVL